MHFYIYILEVVLCSHLVTSQVRKSIHQLQDELYDKIRGTLNSKSAWYKPYEITTYSKFMLCVDVYQKVKNVQLMGGKYLSDKPRMNNPNRSQGRCLLDIPDFNIITMKIRNTSNTNFLTSAIAAIHCPLNTIKFEKIEYHYGMEFFIMESAQPFCFYMVSKNSWSKNEDPNGYIVAEICGPLLDIKYGSSYVEEIFMHRMRTINLEGFKRIQWPELHEMDNEKRFVLCLDIYEKISMTDLYAHPYAAPNRELPKFKNFMTVVSIKSSNNSWLIGHSHLLYCPMHVIIYKQLSFKSFSWKDMPSYFLLQSINEDCYYKLQSITNINPIEMDEIPAFEFYFHGEVCGIFGPTNTDVKQLEADYSQKWSSIRKNDDYISWKELNVMRPVHAKTMCKNVYKKVQKTILEEVEQTAKNSFAGVALRLNNSVSLIQFHINTLHCTFGEKSFHLIESSRIGCVYYFIDDSKYLIRVPIVTIQQEVCGVYPMRHVLKIGPHKLIAPLI